MERIAFKSIDRTAFLRDLDLIEILEHAPILLEAIVVPILPKTNKRSSTRKVLAGEMPKNEG